MTFWKDLRARNICGFLLVATIIITLLALVPYSQGQSDDECRKNLNCSACLQTTTCVWCQDSKFENKTEYRGKYDRCRSNDTMQRLEGKDKCDNILMVQGGVDIHENLPVQRENAANNVIPRHISPQKATISLRIGVPHTIRMTYLDAANKALDLYYLMDLSKTMEDDKKTVAHQSQNLATALKRLTNDVRMGFGSFIDKPIVPFSSSAQLNAKKGNSDNIIRPYSFKNHLRLTSDTAIFTDTVQKAEVSENLDNPEGGFDAIMQAVVCKEELGWRNNSRKLMIVSTDGPFHIAGDGKLLGIVEPNDEKCHLDSKREMYTAYEKYDYPSIAQINKKANEASVYIIFAVTEDQVPMYRQLAKRVRGSDVVTLSADSSNIVSEVEKRYREIVKTLRIQQSPPMIDGLKINYNYTCNGKFFQSDGTSPVECDLSPEDQLDITITMELTKCSDWKQQKIEICPFELCGIERLDLTVEAQCKCDCETQDRTTLSALCSDQGYLVCGQCSCKDGYAGSNCQCQLDGQNSGSLDNDCKNSRGEICSNRGKCQCGICICDKDGGVEYVDKHCEYDDLKCKSGADRTGLCWNNGKCGPQGKCQCNAAYEGDVCNFKKDSGKNCMEPGNNKTECNGKGICGYPSNSITEIVEKKCQCWGSGYTGDFCHIFVKSRRGSICGDQNILNCLLCIDKHDGLKLKEIHESCSQICIAQTTKGVTFSTEVVEKFNDDIELAQCEGKNAEKCIIRYAYDYELGEIRVQVLPRGDNDCPETPWWIIGVVVGSIVLIGILTLLIWKIFTHIHDKREYSRFQQETGNATWNMQSPLYDDPTRNFQNPAYRGN